MSGRWIEELEDKIDTALSAAADDKGYRHYCTVGHELEGAIRALIAFVSNGRCDDCGGPLEPVREDGDGVAMCAECGASWDCDWRR